ncbi:MAG TPA: hypothetical protein VKA09_13030 [Nitrososphaeraceae archaeon]|jgi:hypothetical protein|nr:hypothetical protein [Nitrososphaeraceae archaeon]
MKIDLRDIIVINIEKNILAGQLNENVTLEEGEYRCRLIALSRKFNNIGSDCPL